MKLIYCSKCQYAFNPTTVVQRCNCGDTTGRLKDGQTRYSGTYAHAIFISDVDLTTDIDLVDPSAIRVNSTATQKNEEDRLFCTKVIEYLNHVAGTAFSSRFPSSNTQLIISRRDEHKCTLEDICRVIDNKSLAWKGTAFETYLRPKTLFNKTNFANYLGEKNARKQQPTTKSSITGLVDSANEAKRDIIGGGAEAR